MPSKIIFYFTIFITLGCSTLPDSKDYLSKVDTTKYDYQLPNFDMSVDQISNTIDSKIEQTDRAYDKIGAQDHSKVTFESSLGQLEHVNNELQKSVSVIYLIWNTSQDKKRRQAAKKAIDKIDEWSVEADYREDIYRVVVVLNKAKLKLNPIQQRILDESIKYYKRNGMHLSAKKKAAVKKLKAKLNKLSNNYTENIKNAKQMVTYTKEQLDGVPESYLKKWKTSEGTYTLNAKIFSDYRPVMNYAKRPLTRKKAYIARNTTAIKTNSVLLKEIVQLRAQIAKKLGYRTWAQLKIESRMAKKPKTVMKFLNQLNVGLEPKLKRELAEVRDKKRQLTGKKNAQLDIWDSGFYWNIIKKEKYDVDAEEVKEFFELNRSLNGMFEIYERIFNIKLIEIDPPYKWVSDLRLFSVEDASTGEPMGAIYMDLFPREGKYGHFALFSNFRGHRGADGRYQKPVGTLVCNFDKPTKDMPSLLTHNQLQTLFHEFGHAMHLVLTEAPYASISGTGVQRDFVEAPSQMLENWVWDEKILSKFAKHYKDPEKAFPSDLLKRMKEAKYASIARSNKFQLAMALSDMKLHTLSTQSNNTDVIKITNDIFSKTTGFKQPANTAVITRIGHIVGYDAGYYGYLWAESISDDLASVFQEAPGGYEDKNVGMRLRKEIYSKGNSREAEESVGQFLGRPRSLKPFLKRLGL